MMTAIQDTIEREITVRASKERVFNALIDPLQLVQWFPDGVEGKMELGERPIFDFGEYGKYQIYVTAVDPFDYFAYRWIPGNSDQPEGFLGDVLAFSNTLVEFRLQEGPHGTTVKLKESGFASLPERVAEKSVADNNEGWEVMLDRLEKLMTQ